MIAVGETIQVENIQVKKGVLIGKGAFGFIYQGQITNGTDVALKLQMQISDYEEIILKALKGKKFEHIIQVFAFEQKNDGIFIIMELGKVIDLKSLPDKRMTCLQMAQGVSELHKLNFFHRDLKLDNFVIGKDNKIKLIDFGIARTIVNDALTQNKGTKQYMAPEVYVTQNYDQSVDIWSLGMIFYEIFTNKTFFEKIQTDYDLMKQSVEISQLQINQKLEQQEKNNNITKQQKELLLKMIVQRLDKQEKINESIKRISIDEVINELQKFNYVEQNKQKVQVQEQQVQKQQVSKIDVNKNKQKKLNSERQPSQQSSRLESKQNEQKPQMKSTGQRMLNNQDENKLLKNKLQIGLGTEKMDKAISILRSTLEKMNLQTLEQKYGPNFEKLLPFLTSEERKIYLPLLFQYIKIE